VKRLNEDYLVCETSGTALSYLGLWQWFSSGYWVIFHKLGDLRNKPKYICGKHLCDVLAFWHKEPHLSPILITPPNRNISTKTWAMLWSKNASLKSIESLTQIHNPSKPPRDLPTIRAVYRPCLSRHLNSLQMPDRTEFRRGIPHWFRDQRVIIPQCHNLCILPASIRRPVGGELF